jgi:putative membrane protein
MKKQFSKNFIIIICIAIFYGVGLIGLNIAACSDLFAKMIPFTLLSSTVLCLWVLWNAKKQVLAFLALVFCCGFALEFMGVYTGIIFGPYSYGSNLGWKLFDIPIIIGVNWFLMVVCSSSLVQRIGIKNKWLAIIAAALFMVLTDICLEPFAIRHDLWHWNTLGAYIPLQNFIAWFISAFIFQLISMKWLPKLSHPVTAALALIFMAFFLLDDISHLCF